MKVTIQDIAQEAGVSVTTVSLVLNNRPNRIPSETKQRIFEIAKRHHYVPNFMAKGLVSKQSRTIGLIIPDIENIFFSSLAKHIEEALTKEGYSMFLVNTNDQFNEEMKLLSLLVARGIDGLLITPSYESFEPTNYQQITNELMNLKLPFVMMDRVFDGFACDSVSFDNQLGGLLATNYLLRHGHREIACITSPRFSQNGMKRFEGYKLALENAGVPIHPHWIIEGDYRIQGGYQAGQYLATQPATAVFVANDMMAYGVMKAFRELGKKIPEDISVVGYDNLIFSHMLDVSIASVEQDIALLAATSVQLLMDTLRGSTIRQQIVLTPVLKANGSVCPPQKK